MIIDNFFAAFTPLEIAADIAARFEWCVFPQVWYGPNRRRPLIKDQHQQSTNDIAKIERWWAQSPRALVGVSAGKKSGVICLDIDRKHGCDGFHTLEMLGHVLPETPMEHSPSGGLHVLFALGDVPV